MQEEKNTQSEFASVEENQDLPSYNSYKPANTPTQKKTFLYQKWWFWLILVMIVVYIILFKCVNYVSDNKSDVENSYFGENRSNVGDSYIVIESFRISENYGDPVIIVNYKFTNNSDEPEAFSYSVSANAYQNGIELDTPIVIDDETEYQFDIKYSDVQPGVTTDVEIAYNLRDFISDVTIIVTDRYGVGNQEIRKTFDIKDLADEVLGNKDSQGALGKYYIVIKDFKIIESYGDKLIIVKYIFINNSNESASFNASVSDEAYQNGIGLTTSYFSSQNLNLIIQPGRSIEVDVAYELNNETDDVHIEVTKHGNKKIIKTFNIK